MGRSQRKLDLEGEKERAREWARDRERGYSCPLVHFPNASNIPGLARSVTPCYMSATWIAEFRFPEPAPAPCQAVLSKKRDEKHNPDTPYGILIPEPSVPPAPFLFMNEGNRDWWRAFSIDFWCCDHSIELLFLFYSFSLHFLSSFLLPSSTFLSLFCFLWKLYVLFCIPNRYSSLLVCQVSSQEFTNRLCAERNEYDLPFLAVVHIFTCCQVFISNVKFKQTLLSLLFYSISS